MFKLKRAALSVLFGGTIVVAGLGSACSGRVRVYDRYHSDYHTWDRDENARYRQYWGDRHEQYRDYNHLNQDEQKNYWQWRHDHSDSDRH